jgi:hypothetical protein
MIEGDQNAALIVRFGMLSSRLTWVEPHDSCLTAPLFFKHFKRLGR